MGQRTSVITAVSEGQARLMVRMDEDFVLQYPGGKAKLELAKGHPDIKAETFALWDRLAAEHGRTVALAERPATWPVRLGVPEGWNTKKPWSVAALVGEVEAKTQPVRHRVTDYVKQHLQPNITVVQTVSVEQGVEICPRDLGFESLVRTDVLLPAINNAGFEPLPQETGLHIGNQYGNKLRVGEYIVVVSKPIVGSYGHRHFLYVKRNGDEVVVHDDCASPDGRWHPDDRLLVRRKSK